MRIHLVITQTILLLLTTLACGNAPAQSVPDMTRPDPIEELCKRMATSIVTAMQPQLTAFPALPPPAELVVFTPFLAYLAGAPVNGQRILISRAMCHELYLLADAGAIVSVAFLSEAHRLNDYARYLADKSTRAVKDTPPGQATVLDVKRFVDWAPLERSAITEEIGVMATNLMKNRLYDSLALVIAHEMSHVINQDRPPVPSPTLTEANALRQSRAQEARADKQGYDLAAKVFIFEESPASYNPVFGLMNRMHDKPSTFQDTHPATICRVGYLMQRTNFWRRFGEITLSERHQQYLANLIASASDKFDVPVSTVSDFEKVFNRLLRSRLCMAFWDAPQMFFAVDDPDYGRYAATPAAGTAGLDVGAEIILRAQKIEFEPPTLSQHLGSITAQQSDSGINQTFAQFQGLRYRGTAVGLAIKHMEGQIEIARLIDALESGRPLLVRRKAQDGGSWIVVYGAQMRFEGTPQLRLVSFFDLATRTKGMWTAQQFMANTTSAWDLTPKR